MMLSREESARNSGTGGPSTALTDPSNCPPFGQSESITDQEFAAALEEGVFSWDTDEASSDYKDSQHSESDPIPLSASSSNSSSYENDGARSHSSQRISPVPSLNTRDHLHFPPISVSPTPVNTPGLGSNSPLRANVSSQLSAWNNSLKSPSASPPRVRSTPSVGASPTAQRRTAPLSSRPVNNQEDFDDDLRFALELSLAEARSRGDI